MEVSEAVHDWSDYIHPSAARYAQHALAKVQPNPRRSKRVQTALVGPLETLAEGRLLVLYTKNAIMTSQQHLSLRQDKLA